MTPELLLQILGWVVAGVAGVWALWSKLAPGIVENRLKTKREQITHDQELEETYVGSMVQSMVTSQSDTSRTINQLVTNLISTNTDGMAKIKQEITSLRGIAIRDEAQMAIINMEMSRLVDSMHQQEKDLEAIKRLMMALVPSFPVMTDPEDDE